MIETEEQRLKAQEDHVYRMTQRNEKDDTLSWLMRTGWPEMFSGRDRILISDTRLFTTENRQVHELSIIREADLLVLSRAADRIIGVSRTSVLHNTYWL